MWGDCTDLEPSINDDGFQIKTSKRKRRPTAEEEMEANEVKKNYLKACPEGRKKIKQVVNLLS